MRVVSFLGKSVFPASLTPIRLLRYDASTRLFDTRCGSFVRRWEEPFDEAIYCLATDNNVTLICGTARQEKNSQIQRVLDESNMVLCKQSNSPLSVWLTLNMFYKDNSDFYLRRSRQV